MAKRNQAFKIVALGEDFVAVMHAQELTRRLAAELEPEFEISTDAWKFEMLDNMPLGREAARGVARADMIIIAASGAFEPPARVKRWLESRLPQKKTGATALIALPDHQNEALSKSSPLSAYMRRIARKWGMDFFSHPADWWKQLESKTATCA